MTVAILRTMADIDPDHPIVRAPCRRSIGAAAMSGGTGAV